MFRLILFPENFVSTTVNAANYLWFRMTFFLKLKSKHILVAPQRESAKQWANVEVLSNSTSKIKLCPTMRIRNLPLLPIWPSVFLEFALRQSTYSFNLDSGDVTHWRTRCPARQFLECLRMGLWIKQLWRLLLSARQKCKMAFADLRTLANVQEISPW